MENLYIESTDTSPRISFDVKNHKFELSGSSRPEDVISFYGSVIYKIENYVKKVIDTESNLSEFNFEVKCDLLYMNSASSKYILQILDHFKKLHSNDAKIKVDWYYEDVDDQILEDGEDLSDVIKIPFNFIPR